MVPSEEFFSPQANPDLEEFLSALNGFLTKQTTPGDPGYIKFLEIFFRTVKANTGHLLKVNDEGRLDSVVSYGMDKSFDEIFNRAHKAALNEPCPLDICFHQKDVVAIVDLSKDPDIPSWYLKLMKQFHFSSLVAVPLMGRTKPVGILCAYYEDICLFDQSTLGHLMMIGRMVGGATEKTLVADEAESHGEKEKILDQFLTILLSRTFGKPEIFSLLSKIIRSSLSFDGFICGPLVKADQRILLQSLGTAGLPDGILPSRFALPQFILKQLEHGIARHIHMGVELNDWGEMKVLFKASLPSVLSVSIDWQNKPQGIIIAWRKKTPSFSEEDMLLLGRLAGISSLALNTVNLS